MKSWAYRVYNAQKGFTSPYFSGTFHANSMDEVVDKVIKSCKINVHKSTDRFGFVDSKFTLNNIKVTIVVYASPEYH